MSPLFKQSAFCSVAIALLLMGGCGGDGKNASDNPNTAPQLVSSNGSSGGSSVEPLPEAGAPLVIDGEDEGSVDTAKAVIDGGGNVTAVWTQSDGASINLWSSRYKVGSGWSNAQKLESGALDVKSFQVVMDAAGNVTVVWTQATADFYMAGPTRIDVERTDLWATRFDAIAVGWSVEATIESSNLSAITTESIDDIGEFQMVVDSGGNVSVLWSQHNGSRYDLYASRNVAGVWDTSPALVDSEDLGDVSVPQLLVDSTGRLLALWNQLDGTYRNLWGARYEGGWSVAAKLDSEDLGDVEAPQAVMASNGEATVSWRQFDGQYWNLWTVRYSGGWGVAAKAETLAGDVRAPQLLLYGTTKVMLLWVQSDGAAIPVNNVWSSHYDLGWVADGVITNSEGDSGSVVMVADGNGAVTAAWIQHSVSVFAPVDDLWSNRFSSGSWGSASVIETGSDGDVRSPMLMVDSLYRVSAIWLQREGGRFDLWSNRYTYTNAIGNWGTATLVEGMDDGSAVDPRAVMSSSGNITLVWRHPYDSGNHLVTNNYTVGAASGWGIVAKVESTNYDSGYSPLLLVDGSGIVTVIWLQPVVVNAGSIQTVRIDLWANRF